MGRSDDPGGGRRDPRVGRRDIRMAPQDPDVAVRNSKACQPAVKCQLHGLTASVTSVRGEDKRSLADKATAMTVYKACREEIFHNQAVSFHT